MALTAKQQAFVNEYMKDFNATQSAIRAGYSERTAYAIGHENLKKPEISDEIQRRVDEKAMSADEVLIRLAEQARADIADFVDVWDGGFKINIEKALAAGKGHLIRKIGFNQYGKPEIELHNQQSALQLLGKVHSLFTDKVEQSGEVIHKVKTYHVVSPDDWDNDTDTSD